MKMQNALASVCINGKYFPISKGMTEVEGLNIDLVLENRADNFYPRVVYLENNSNEKSPRITDFYGLDTAFSVNGKVKFNTLRGDDCSIYSFYPESFEMEQNTVITRSPIGARPSDTTAFPYFDIEDSEAKGWYVFYRRGYYTKGYY